MFDRDSQQVAHEPLLSPSLAAKMLGVSPAALEKWARVGGGPPYVRVGRLRRYHPKAIREWIDGRTFSSTSEESAG